MAGPAGARQVGAGDFFVADGIRNTRRIAEEVLTEIILPVVKARRSAYQKLRQRNSIDFPLLSVAVAGDFAADDTVASLSGVVSALGARPRVLMRWEALALGRRLDDSLVRTLAERARKQCRPLDNMIIDAGWRRAMVSVYMRRALNALKSSPDRQKENPA